MKGDKMGESDMEQEGENRKVMERGIGKKKGKKCILHYFFNISLWIKCEGAGVITMCNSVHNTKYLFWTCSSKNPIHFLQGFNFYNVNRHKIE
jgi:hypothetical protein